VRIISGHLGGRRLKAPRGSGTRPTSDRVREALFMTLEPLAGLRVVDLYAGSGALGIEALSRGAAWADFVERDAGARRVLEENLAALGLEACSRVWALELPRGLGRLEAALRRADLVLADPPYGGEAARAVLEALGRDGPWRLGARVVLEHHAKDGVPESAGGLARVRTRRYGETMVSTYEPAGPPGAGEEGR
jgi:16S rRNA (guanine966-N2)-methyltransferase